MFENFPGLSVCFEGCLCVSNHISEDGSQLMSSLVKYSVFGSVFRFANMGAQRTHGNLDFVKIVDFSGLKIVFVIHFVHVRHILKQVIDVEQEVHISLYLWEVCMHEHDSKVLECCSSWVVHFVLDENVVHLVNIVYMVEIYVGRFVEL